MGQESSTTSQTAADLLAAGDIDALLAFHRGTFGGWRMDADGDGGDTGGDPDGGDPAGDTGDPDPDDIDPDTGKPIDPKLKAARDDAAKRRVQAREARQQAAAEKARADAAEARAAAILKAAGFNPDGTPLGDGKTGDDTASKADRERAEKAEAKLRSMAAEVAVAREAPKHKADAQALLDSRTFMSSIEGLDPEDDDYSDQVAEAIKDAIKSNSKLRAGQGSSRSGSEFDGGPDERGKRPKSIAEAARRAYAK